MTWRERVLVRILMLVAGMFADDDVMQDELRKLAIHIDVHGKAELDNALSTPPRSVLYEVGTTDGQLTDN